MRKIAQFKKGQFVVVTTGSYSDYTIERVGLALKDFDEEDLVALCIEDSTQHTSYTMGIIGRQGVSRPSIATFTDPDAVIDNLIDRGYIAELSYSELHIPLEL